MLNVIQIIGHLGKDVETRYMPSGDAVCNFSVATTEKWTKDGERQERTEWHRVSAFGKLAEICSQYLSKGSLVYVSGKLTSNKYTDKDGIERVSYEIRASEMKMLGGKGDRETESKPEPKQERRAAASISDIDDLDSDIPF